MTHKPQLTGKQLGRLTEMAYDAAKELTQDRRLERIVDHYLEQCYYPDVDTENGNLELGYNHWIRAKFFDLFGVYFKHEIDALAKANMMDAASFFDLEDTPPLPQDTMARTECACTTMKGRMINGAFHPCNHLLSGCNCRPIPHPDHDQRAEGLGDGY